MPSQKSIQKYSELVCPNCKYPFSGHEKFCPECGQKNQQKKLYFSTFISEIFKGFTSWDAKFWKTTTLLVSQPGKVPKYYVEGKRSRFVNPFRFYMTASIVFFLIIGIGNTFEKFNTLQQEKKPAIISSQKEAKQETLVAKDSVALEAKNTLKDDYKISIFMKFQKKHPKLTSNQALDSLAMPKTFSNRFWYSRAELANKLFNGSEKNSDAFAKKTMSYVSISLFILLPLFCLFLKLLYVRHKHTYIEHLIFVFYTQSVFFILFAIYSIIRFFTESELLLNFFLLLFLIYLFIAMKKFYEQGNSKTLLKFCLANFAYVILTLIGIAALLVITFAIY